MKPYSLDLRERVVSAVGKGDSSVRKVAVRFGVSKSCVKQQRAEGHVLPLKQGGSMVSPLMEYKEQLMAICLQHKDATLAEYCELLADATGLWVSPSTLCRTLQKLNLGRKKRHFALAKL